MSRHTTTVLLGGREAATITDSVDGLRLTYEPDWFKDAEAVPISVSLGLDRVTHVGPKVERWLDGLVPGSTAARAALARTHNAESERPLDLLRTHAGHDCAGALQFALSGLEHRATDGGSQQVMSDFEVSRLLVSMYFEPESWGGSIAESGPFSLPGSFPKKTVSFTETGQWLECSGKHPTEWIIKPSTERDQGLATNELICLRTAMALGTPTAECRLMSVEGVDVVAVKRFDRRRQGKIVRRFHCEDLHLAINDGRDIYQKRGGASPCEIADHLREHHLRNSTTNPVARYLSQLATRWLLWDTDGHTKNYAHLLLTAGTLLAPLYDIWSQAATLPRDPYALSHAVAAYPPTMDTARLLTADDTDFWKAMAQELQLSRPRVRRFLDRMTARYGVASAEAISQAHKSQGDPDAIDAFNDSRTKRLEKLRDAGWTTQPDRSATLSHTATIASQSSRSELTAVLDAPRCGKWMPRARRYCNRRLQHPGGCQ